MFENFFSEYSMLAITVAAGIIIVLGMFFNSLFGIGDTVRNFINS
ncbi:hypothetical protein ACEK07_45050 [Alcanivoracaceae bacterium MT1]